MKKSMILAGAALVALVACNKSETVVKETQGNKIAFKAVASTVTKADAETPEMVGANLPQSNNTVRLYAAATTYTSSGNSENPDFFGVASTAGQQFGYNNSAHNWIPGAPTDETAVATPTDFYWPLGGSTVDFLAYAEYVATSATHSGTLAGHVVPTWGSPDKADEMTFTDINLTDNKLDLMYGAANSQKGITTGADANYRTVPIIFHHAGAVIKVNITSNVAIDIEDVYFANLYKEEATMATNKYATLDKIGTLKVDNTKNTLTTTWTGIDQTNSGAYCVIGSAEKFVPWHDHATLAADAKTEVDNMIVIPQPKLDFVINYTANSKNYYVTAKTPKGVWAEGHKYVYDINITFAKVEITDSVVVYTVIDEADIDLS